MCPCEKLPLRGSRQRGILVMCKGLDSGMLYSMFPFLGAEKLLRVGGATSEFISNTFENYPMKRRKTLKMGTAN